MTSIYISLGSTSNGTPYPRRPRCPAREVRRVADLPGIRERGGGLQQPPFYNLVGCRPSCPGDPVPAAARHGFATAAEPDAKKFAPRTLDLDLLLYGDLVCETPWRCRAARSSPTPSCSGRWQVICAIPSMAVPMVSCGRLRQASQRSAHPPATGSGRTAASLIDKGTLAVPLVALISTDKERRVIGPAPVAA